MWDRSGLKLGRVKSEKMNWRESTGGKMRREKLFLKGNCRHVGSVLLGICAAGCEKVPLEKE